MLQETSSVTVAQGCAARYRARNPRATPLYRLFETHFDEVRGQWEERFERRCGYWRGFVDEQVRRYLDCGLFENGFARIRCPECSEEYLLAFSCKTRELCPSCAAKRSAATAALLADEVFEEVGHAQDRYHVSQSHILSTEARTPQRDTWYLVSFLWF